MLEHAFVHAGLLIDLSSLAVVAEGPEAAVRFEFLIDAFFQVVGSGVAGRLQVEVDLAIRPDVGEVASRRLAGMEQLENLVTNRIPGANAMRRGMAKGPPLCHAGPEFLAAVEFG
jgi:hypothetical protein